MSSQGTTNLPCAEALTKGHCISLGNLHFMADRNGIEKTVKDKVVSDRVLCWPDHGVDHNGWCHIQFVDQASADEALVTLDGLKIRGRPASDAKTKEPIESFLRVSAAQAPTSQPSNSSGPAHQSQTTSSPAAQAPTSQADSAGPVHESQITSSPEAAQANTAIAEENAALSLSPWPPREWIYNPENPDSMKRPSPRAGLGWGGHDLFDEWQAHGRGVTQDMVEDKPWNPSSAKFDFVTEGDTGDVIHVSEKLKGEEEVGFEDPPKPLRAKPTERKMRDGQP
ncbi:hypothetical protein DL770_010944 [Monosporascus sp. CRB-9-2]|nr:hypothetical protein DL770_010944 [Monosporascus sp. CRB-9-2]